MGLSSRGLEEQRPNSDVLWSLEGSFWHRDDDGNFCIVQRLAVQWNHFQTWCWWTNSPVDMMNIHLNIYCEYRKWCSIWYIYPHQKELTQTKLSLQSWAPLTLTKEKKQEIILCNNISMWVFPYMVVPPKHRKMIIFSRKANGYWVPPF